MKKRNKMKNILIVVFVLVIGVSVILTIKDRFNKTNINTEAKSDDIKTELYPDDIKDYAIQTTYGDLMFPEEWSQYVQTEVVKTDASETVQFWFQTEGKEKVHIFDIIFGGEGYLLGSIKLNEIEINVSIESYSYELDDSWTESEKNTIKCVEHDINYLLKNLEKLDGFVESE